MGEHSLLNDALDKGIQLTPFLIIGRADIIHAVVKQEVGNLILLALLVKSDGDTPLLFYEGHTGNIAMH